MSWSSGWLKAAAEGFKAHGLNPKETGTSDTTECDLALFWGHRQTKIIERQKKNNADYMTLERGFLGDRFVETALCFNGLNGHADWSHCERSPADRFESKFSDLVRGCYLNLDGDFLVIGQVPGDASLAGLNIDQWYDEIIAEIKLNFPEKRVVFRPHPQALRNNTVTIPSGADAQSYVGLMRDFTLACCVVTLNSNTAVESVLAGVPTVTCNPGSMAYEVSRHEVSSIEQSPDRKQWTYNLAYKQWTMDEIKTGVAWDHAKRRYGL